MSKRPSQTPKPLPQQHRFEPIGESLAWERKIFNSASLEQRKIGHFVLKPEWMIYAIAQQMELIATFRGRADFQIPIDCR